MPLTQPLTKFTTTSQSIVSYDWRDFASNIGYISFYPTGFLDSSGNTFKLSTTQLIGQPYKATIATGNDFDEDFDVEFKSSMTIKGNVHLNFTVNTQGSNSNIYVNIEFFKVVGGTPTSIVSTRSPTRTDINGYEGENLEVEFPETHFNIGDILRANITAVNSGGNQSFFWYDPSANDSFSGLGGRTLTSRFKIEIPFNINE